MPMFKRSRCEAMENTATTTGYWWNKAQGLPVLCSECADGKWHGLFPKRKPLDELHQMDHEDAKGGATPTVEARHE